MSVPVVLDSSVWIEILTGGPLRQKCEEFFKSNRRVFVPVVVLFEVYRKVSRQVSEDQALSAVTTLSQHSVLNLEPSTALTAADLSIQHGIGMADSMILAHAFLSGAILVTLDNDFSNIPGVTVIR